MKVFSEPVTHLIVHCAAAPKGSERIIKNWHVNDNKWDDIGYHFVILNGYPYPTKSTYLSFLDGSISPGRDLQYQGAHCADGGMNGKSVGVCLIGDKTFTSAQFKSLVTLHDTLCAYYGTNLIVEPHRKYNVAKTCPNFEPVVEMEKAKLIQEIPDTLIKPENDPYIDLKNPNITVAEFFRKIGLNLEIIE